MSQADIIAQGLIREKKLKKMSAMGEAKTSLRALINDAAYAQGKDIEDINTEGLKSHLDNLIKRQGEVRQLISEIKELEY